MEYQYNIKSILGSTASNKLAGNVFMNGLDTGSDRGTATTTDNDGNSNEQ
jgi:hypothetical protein